MYLNELDFSLFDHLTNHETLTESQHIVFVKTWKPSPERRVGSLPTVGQGTVFRRTSSERNLEAGRQISSVEVENELGGGPHILWSVYL